MGWKRDQDTWTPLKQEVLSERIYSSETRLCRVDLSRVASVQKFENQQSSRDRPEESTYKPACRRTIIKPDERLRERRASFLTDEMITKISTS
eukprot:scaffold19132_cov146-Skeletonema_marinoi.AAC.2